MFNAIGEFKYGRFEAQLIFGAKPSSTSGFAPVLDELRVVDS